MEVTKAVLKLFWLYGVLETNETNEKMCLVTLTNKNKNLRWGKTKGIVNRLRVGVGRV